MTRFTAIGVDVGGTKITAGRVLFPEAIVEVHYTIPTQAGRGADAVLRDCEALVAQIASKPGTGSAVIQGIGVGVCEIVDRVGSIASANCLNWTSTKVQLSFAAFGPVCVEADVRAAALAESRFGAGKDARTFLYVSIGTGIASCLVIEGEPFTGARGATGTMASGPIPTIGSTRGDQAQLSLEQFSAGPALAARFNTLGANVHSAEEVFAAADQGNQRASDIIESAAASLGAHIGALVNVLDPELVVLGGGLGLMGGSYRESLITAARHHIWWDGHRDLPILPAKTGLAAGLIGAAACAWRRFG